MKRALKRAAALAGGLVARHTPGVRVLCYHRVGGGSAFELDLASDVFDAQLTELERRGPIVSLDAALAALARGETPDVSVITFDDGYRDAFEHAVPLLRRHNAPALFYLSSAFMRSGWIPLGDRQIPAITADALQAYRGDPLLSFGTHGDTHRVLTLLDDDMVREELRVSRALVSEWTGVDAVHFAYPKAIWDVRTERLVRETCASAAIGGSRPATQSTDRYRIRRFPIQRSDTGALFGAKLDGALIVEDAARAARDRLRAAFGRVPAR